METPQPVVIGYLHRAEILCPLDLIMAGCASGLITVDIDARETVESVLDAQAKAMGINRADEHAFDSWRFPKRVVAGSCGDAAFCDRCDRLLGEQQHFADDPE